MVDITGNLAFLLIEARIRMCACGCYPLKQMRRNGCCVFTRIRMMLVDYIAFFYIFFSQSVKVMALYFKRYNSEQEKALLISLVAINSVFLIFWLFGTSKKSFNNFPRERRNNSLENHS